MQTNEKSILQRINESLPTEVKLLVSVLGVGAFAYFGSGTPEVQASTIPTLSPNPDNIALVSNNSNEGSEKELAMPEMEIIREWSPTGKFMTYGSIDNPNPKVGDTITFTLVGESPKLDKATFEIYDPNNIKTKIVNTNGVVSGSNTIFTFSVPITKSGGYGIYCTTGYYSGVIRISAQGGMSFNTAQETPPPPAPTFTPTTQETATLNPPTATSTTAPATATSVPPTATIPAPTNTPETPTATATPIPPTATATETATFTPTPTATATNTPTPTLTATFTPTPTNTPPPPSATPTPTATKIPTPPSHVVYIPVVLKN